MFIVVNTVLIDYTVFVVKPKGTRPLNINLTNELWERIDKFRHQQMFATRTEAIEFLLDHALRQKPKREQPNAPAAR